MRPGTIITGILIVVVGFAIGGWLALRGRGPAEPVRRVAVTGETRSARPLRAAAPTARPTPLATAAPLATASPLATATPLVTPRVIATATSVATPEPTATPRVLPTAAPVAPTAGTVAVAGPQGAWQLDEANVQVGTIVWTGAVTPSGATIELNVHKQRVGGRAAMPCERQTGLHAAFSAGVAEQTVPYREVNCEGIVSTGEVHVTNFTPNGGAFSGSFSHNGVSLGTFSAHKL